VTASPLTVDSLLGNLSVSGWIRNSTINAYGNLGMITTAGMDSSTLFAGVSSGALPSQLSDFEDAYPCVVKSFVVKGVKNGSGEYVESFINSGVAAPSFGTLNLCNAQTVNAATFGIVAHAIAKMSYKDASGVLSKAAMAAPSDSLTIGDFEILIV
jgi:hypothetical protein